MTRTIIVEYREELPHSEIDKPAMFVTIGSDDRHNINTLLAVARNVAADMRDNGLFAQVAVHES